MTYTYKATVLSVYDGDGSFDVLVDMGMNLTRRKSVRLYAVDTPEIRGAQKHAGVVVRDYVRKLMLDKEVLLTTKKDKTGKYGRLLADIDIGGLDLGELLVSQGYAKPYFGGKKQPWAEEELNNILSNKEVS